MLLAWLLLVAALLLLAGLLLAATLLAGLLIGTLILLARIWGLVAHSRSPLLNTSPNQPPGTRLVAREQPFRRDDADYVSIP
jgi:hypothetical protein